MRAPSTATAVAEDLRNSRRVLDIWSVSEVLEWLLVVHVSTPDWVGKSRQRDQRQPKFQAREVEVAGRQAEERGRRTGADVARILAVEMISPPAVRGECYSSELPVAQPAGLGRLSGVGSCHIFR